MVRGSLLVLIFVGSLLLASGTTWSPSSITAADTANSIAAQRSSINASAPTQLSGKTSNILTIREIANPTSPVFDITKDPTSVASISKIMLEVSKVAMIINKITPVYSRDIQEYQCLPDTNSNYYCPQDISACDSVQNIYDGYSQEHVGAQTGTALVYPSACQIGVLTSSGSSNVCSNTTLTSPVCLTGEALSTNGLVCDKNCTSTVYSCPSGGTLSGTTCTIASSTYTATATGSTLYSNGTATSATLYSDGTAGTATTLKNNGTAGTATTLKNNGTAGTATTLKNNGTAGTATTLKNNGTAGTATTLKNNGTAGTATTLKNNGTAGTATTLKNNGTAGTATTLKNNGTATAATLYSNGTATAITSCPTGTTFNTAANLCYDDVHKTVQNYAGAGTTCSNKSMRLPALSETSAGAPTKIPSSYANCWTTTGLVAGTYYTWLFNGYVTKAATGTGAFICVGSKTTSYNYTCSTGYTAGVTSGTTSTPPTNNCSKASYTYSCSTGYTAGVTSGTTSTPPTNNCSKTTYPYSCSTGYTAGVTSGTSSTPPTNNCSKTTYPYSCSTGYTAGVTSGTSSTPPTDNCSKTTYPYSCSTGYTAGVTSGTSSTPPTDNCSKTTYPYSCSTGYTAGVTSGTSSTPPTDNCSKTTYPYSCSTGYTAGVTSGTTSTPPTNNCSKASYTYSCSTGYTAGVTSGTTSTPPTNNCSKTTYPYSCSTGYTAGVTSGTSSTPPTDNCSKANYNYTCPSGYTASATSGTSSTSPINNCSETTYTYSCPTGGTLSGTTCTFSASTYTATGTGVITNCSYSSSCQSGVLSSASYTATPTTSSGCPTLSVPYSYWSTNTGVFGEYYSPIIYSGNKTFIGTLSNNPAPFVYPYCSYGWYLDGASATYIEMKMPVVKTTTYSCQTGGTLSGTACTIADNNACSNTAVTSPICPDGGVLSTNGLECSLSQNTYYTYHCNLDPATCMGTYANEWLKDMYANLLGRCPDQAGYDYWLAEIQRLGYTSSSQLQSSFCAAALLNGVTCGSSVLNVYGASYVALNPGGTSSTSSTPPVNNCVQQNFLCNKKPGTACSKINGTWSCSAFDCDVNHKCGIAKCTQGIPQPSGTTYSNSTLVGQNTTAICNGVVCDAAAFERLGNCQGITKCPTVFGVYTLNGNCYQDVCPPNATEKDLGGGNTSCLSLQCPAGYVENANGKCDVQ